MIPETFGQHSSSRTVIFEWHSHYEADRVSVENDRCSRRSSTSKMIENVEETENIEETVELVYEDHRRTIRELADTKVAAHNCVSFAMREG
jgi:hypothetical protein